MRMLWPSLERVHEHGEQAQLVLKPDRQEVAAWVHADRQDLLRELPQQLAAPARPATQKLRKQRCALG